VGTSTTSYGAVWQDAYTLTLSHELAETISDPDNNGIRVNPPSTLPASLLSPGGNQIGDYEPEPNGGIHYGYRLNGNWVQPYWSNQDNAFIVPDGNRQSFYLNPIWNSDNTFTGTYNLKVQGDQLGVNYADNIRIDQSAITSGVKVTMNGEAAEFDSHVIQAVNVDTGGGSNYVQAAAFPQGVNLNIDSTGPSNDTVFVGSDTGSLFAIRGSVNVSNTSGQTQLIVDDFNDGPSNVAITDHSVAFAGLTTVNYEGGFRWYDGSLHGVTTLGVVDGQGANHVDVASVPALTSVILWSDTQDTVYGPAAWMINIDPTHT
jgi:hypothetical protein